MWDHLGGDPSAYARISRALGEFYLSPYSNNGYDGLDDIDQDEAAATYYTANCVMHEIVDFALLSASRATDNIDHQWYGKDEERQAGRDHQRNPTAGLRSRRHHRSSSQGSSSESRRFRGPDHETARLNPHRTDPISNLRPDQAVPSWWGQSQSELTQPPAKAT